MQDYREQITGWLADADGTIPLWIQPEPETGLPVQFHGRTLRDSGEVLLMAEDAAQTMLDWDDNLGQLLARSILSLTLWQLEALPEGATLEIHCAHPDGAYALRELFARHGVLGVTVRFTPRPGEDWTPGRR